jgi:AraC-like DNA-binding protein
MDFSGFLRCSRFRIGLANYFAPHPERNEWGPRVIKDYEFVFQVKGRGLYIEKEKQIPLDENDLLLIPPDTLHTYTCKLSDKSFISCIHLWPDKKVNPVPAVKFYTENDPEILNVFRKSAYEWETRGPLYEQLLDRHVSEIWIRLSRLQEGPKELEEPIRIRQAKAFIGKRFKERITRRDIAGHLDITPEHLNFLFKRYCHQTPMECLNDFRLRTAKILLKNPGWNVSRTAYEVGFEDPLYFSRVFKKSVGISPRQYAAQL